MSYNVVEVCFTVCMKSLINPEETYVDDLLIAMLEDNGINPNTLNTVSDFVDTMRDILLGKDISAEQMLNDISEPNKNSMTMMILQEKRDWIVEETAAIIEDIPDEGDEEKAENQYEYSAALTILDHLKATDDFDEIFELRGLIDEVKENVIPDLIIFYNSQQSLTP